MLNAFVCQNGHKQRLQGSATAETLRAAVWIDLVQATPEEVRMVQEATGLRVPTEADVSEIETSSRLAMRGGVLYLSMPLISMTKSGAAGTAAGFIVAPDRLITQRFATSSVFDNFSQTETAASGAAEVFVALLEAIVDRQADVLERVRAELDTMSHAIFAMGVQETGGRKLEDAMLRRTLGELGRIGDLISHVRDTQVGAARIVPYVQLTTADWLPKELRPRLKTLRLDIASVSDFDTHLNDKLQFLLDATLGFINIAQNNVMKVMAIASVVGIPPVLIAGIYGMNFKTMPELEWAFGYLWGWGLIVLTTLLPLAAFRWKKWI
jgi:magnesium transporter